MANEQPRNTQEPANNSTKTLKIVENVATDTAEVYLYDVIGEGFFGGGVSAKTFSDQIKAIKSKNINLRINSPGGNALEGFAMYNALKGKNARVVVDIDGAALSAASFIAMAGDEIRIAKNAFVMIHDPSTMVAGNAAEMRRTAELLDKVRDNIVQSYVDKSRRDAKTFVDAMAAETWYTAREAVDAGLADTITDFAGVAACYQAPWVKVPQRIADIVTPTDEQIRENEEIRARLKAFEA